MAKRDITGMSPDDFQAMVQSRRVARMEAIDRLPHEIRELVHDYGFTVVRAIMDQGVTKPNKIRHIVETVLDEFSPTRGTFSSQGKTTAPRT